MNHPIHRRKLLLGAGLSPFIQACANHVDDSSLPATRLAAQLGVDLANYAIIKNGQTDQVTTFSGFPGRQESLPTDAVFQAASLTKPVVAYAALQLVLSGNLRLDLPVSHYLPQGYKHFHSLLNRSDQAPHDIMPAGILAQIPLGTLLNHTSGLPNWSRKAMSLSFTPGTQWLYSGEGYMLLQSVLESITGQGFKQYMDAAVFAPLGMTQSSLIWSERAMTTHTKANPGLWSSAPARINYSLAAASLYTNATDYARFLGSLVRQHDLVALTLSSPVQANTDLGIAWGYGWGIEQGATGPMLWHWGNNPGYRAFAMLHPHTGDGFVFFTNHHRGLALVPSITREVLPGNHQALRFPLVVQSS